MYLPVHGDKFRVCNARVSWQLQLRAWYVKAAVEAPKLWRQETSAVHLDCVALRGWQACPARGCSACYGLLKHVHTIWESVLWLTLFAVHNHESQFVSECNATSLQNCWFTLQEIGYLAQRKWIQSLCLWLGKDRVCKWMEGCTKTAKRNIQIGFALSTSTCQLGSRTKWHTVESIMFRKGIIYMCMRKAVACLILWVNIARPRWRWVMSVHTGLQVHVCMHRWEDNK